MANPRTTREALIAVMLGDLDKLLERVEQLPNTLVTCENKLQQTIKALNEAGDKYRSAVNVFSSQARAELTDYLQHTANEISTKAVEEQRIALHAAANAAFRTEAIEQATKLSLALTQAATAFHRSSKSRLLEHGLTALVSSILTAGFVLYVVRYT